MDDETRSAALPRWRGAAGRLEVWYATLSDPLTRTGLWVHCETVAPTTGGPYAHGWVTWFPPDARRAPSAWAPSPPNPRPAPPGSTSPVYEWRQRS